MTALPAHLKALEAESIHILREVAAQAARPVLLYSIGKDSSVLLHLARKAFFPARPPFPLLHIDTTWKFRDMIRHRDATARRIRAGAARPHQPGRRAAEHQPVRPRQQLHPDHEDRRAEAGADRRPLRLRHRRRAARRGTFARQGTRLLGARPRPHLGAEAPAAGTLAPVQRQPRAGRDPARVPVVQLDRARRVDLHPGGRHRGRAAVFRRRAPHRRCATAR